MSDQCFAAIVPDNYKNAILIQGAMDCEICDLLSHMEDVQKTELMQFPFYICLLYTSPSPRDTR